MISTVIAEKLLLLMSGEKVPASKLKYPVITELITEGILHKPGKIKSNVQLINKEQLELFLKNCFAIHDLGKYIETAKKVEVQRAELVEVSSNSKLKAVRTFKGFLVNCNTPVQTVFNGSPYVVNPTEGTFQFIYDFEKFFPNKHLTIVGIENPENFRNIHKQQFLFKNINPLFVSRYPQNQSKDLIKWLQYIPNNYIHFGDFDFAGIGIYLHEFRKYLSVKSSFFIPENIEQLIYKFGNKERYDVQRINFDIGKIDDQNLLKLIETIHKYKKGLDQEVLINIIE